MHPHTGFHWHDRPAMRAYVEAAGFGTLFAQTPDGPRVAQVPVVFEDDDTIAFHLSRGNALARHLDGLTGLFTVLGPDAYVSPDWYGLGPDQVPTWNYVAVELEGPVTAFPRDHMKAHIDQLGHTHEAPLAPKPEWRLDKVDPGYVAKLMNGIAGFRMSITAWRGTRKLGQTKPPEAREAAAQALEAQGRRAIAHWMRNL